MKRLALVLLGAALLPTLAFAEGTPDPTPVVSHTYEVQIIQSQNHRLIESRTITLKEGETAELKHTQTMMYTKQSSVHVTPIGAVFESRNGQPIPSFDKIQSQEPALAALAIQMYGNPDNKGNFVKTDEIKAPLEIGSRILLIQAPNHFLAASVSESKTDQLYYFSAPTAENATRPEDQEDDSSNTPPGDTTKVTSVSDSGENSVVVNGNDTQVVMTAKKDIQVSSKKKEAPTPKGDDASVYLNDGPAATIAMPSVSMKMFQQRFNFTNTPTASMKLDGYTLTITAKD